MNQGRGAKNLFHLTFIKTVKGALSYKGEVSKLVFPAGENFKISWKQGYQPPWLVKKHLKGAHVVCSQDTKVKLGTCSGENFKKVGNRSSLLARL